MCKIGLLPVADCELVAVFARTVIETETRPTEIGFLIGSLLVGSAYRYTRGAYLKNWDQIIHVGINSSCKCRRHRKHFEILDPQIAVNALKLSILPLWRYFVSFYVFTIPSGRPFWHLGDGGGGGRHHAHSSAYGPEKDQRLCFVCYLQPSFPAAKLKLSLTLRLIK